MAYTHVPTASICSAFIARSTRTHDRSRVCRFGVFRELMDSDPLDMRTILAQVTFLIMCPPFIRAFARCILPLVFAWHLSLSAHATDSRIHRIPNFSCIPTSLFPVTTALLTFLLHLSYGVVFPRVSSLSLLSFRSAPPLYQYVLSPLPCRVVLACPQHTSTFTTN